MLAPRRSSRLLAVVLSLLAILMAVCAAAASAPPADFTDAVAALERGAYGDAIDHFELLADRGFLHPDVSFDRAIAYIGRARSPQRQAGDLGRAAAALAEALALRPGDHAAKNALDAVRAEIGRQRARTGSAPLVARPRLIRAIVGLVPEEVWGGLAALGSLSLSWGLVLRLLYRRSSTEVPGALGIGVGALLLCVGGGLAAGARHFRLTSTLAVVVAPEARLLDGSGRPLQMSPGESNLVPEGAQVYVTDHQGALARVEWGSTDGYVVASQIYEMPRR